MIAALFLLLWAGAQPQLPTLILPPEEGAWVIRVETSGGFTGRGTGSLTVSSLGDVFCLSIATCPDRLAADAQQSLSDLVTVIPFGGAPVSPPSNQTVCSDCVTTKMIIRRRAADGERTVAYTWDPGTAAALPEEIRRLHAAVLSITARRDR